MSLSQPACLVTSRCPWELISADGVQTSATPSAAAQPCVPVAPLTSGPNRTSQTLPAPVRSSSHSSFLLITPLSRSSFRSLVSFCPLLSCPRSPSHRRSPPPLFFLALCVGSYQVNARIMVEAGPFVPSNLYPRE